MPLSNHYHNHGGRDGNSFESVEYAEIVQSVDIKEFGGCRTSVGEIDRVADRENFFFLVIVALLDTPPFYSHFRLIARGKRQVVTGLAALSYPLQFRVLKCSGGGDIIISVVLPIILSLSIIK